jgi:hypothetical protein
MIRLMATCPADVSRRTVAFILSTATALMACGCGTDLPPVTAETRALYERRCVQCHGADGTGNGPVAAGLGARVPNFTDGGWQSDTSDDRMRAIIVQGGASVGGSPVMPPHPDLAGTPSLDNLIVLIRSF